MQAERTHRVVQQALTALGCMEHRGGCSADDDSGDGAGVMTQIPWKLLSAWAAKAGVADVAEGKAAVGMLFLPKEGPALAQAKALVAKVLCGMLARRLAVAIARDGAQAAAVAEAAAAAQRDARAAPLPAPAAAATPRFWGAASPTRTHRKHA
jgi:glutamate synthase domain-containing protein 1